MPAEITLQETETESGWIFCVQIAEGEAMRELEMSLSWADYEYWGRGIVRPVDVAKALLRVATAQLDSGILPDRFDAARLRRTIAHFDDRVRAEIGCEDLGGDQSV
jgi:hypothetical protein